MPKGQRSTTTPSNKRSSPSGVEKALPKKRTRKQNANPASANNKTNRLNEVEYDSSAISQVNPPKKTSNTTNKRNTKRVPSAASDPIDEEVEAEEEFTMASTPTTFATSMTKYATGTNVSPIYSLFYIIHNLTIGDITITSLLRAPIRGRRQVFSGLRRLQQDIGIPKDRSHTSRLLRLSFSRESTRGGNVDR